MDLLIIISNPASTAIAAPLAKACGNAGIEWAAFFTNDGVRTLDNGALTEALGSASKAIACQESWQEHMGNADCPVELGSQTNNSTLVGQAHRVLSL